MSEEQRACQRITARLKDCDSSQAVPVSASKSYEGREASHVDGGDSSFCCNTCRRGRVPSHNRHKRGVQCGRTRLLVLPVELGEQQRGFRAFLGRRRFIQPHFVHRYYERQQPENLRQWGHGHVRVWPCSSLAVLRLRGARVARRDHQRRASPVHRGGG